MFLDQLVAITQPVNLGNGARFKAEYSDNADLSAPKLIPTEANASTKIAQSTTGKTYYVSATGNDKNDGLKESTAFRTLQKAADLVQAGDTVYIMNGTYTQANPLQDIMRLNKKHGKPNAPITFKAYPGHKPFLKSRNFVAIRLLGSSYITIEGLTLEGNNDNINLQYALQQKNNTNNPATSGGGFGIRDFSHHIVIRNNKISKFGGGAIGAFKSDYITYENNVVYQNCFYSPWGTNALTMLHNWNSDNNTSQYKMIVRGNIVYENKSLVPWKDAGKITEGHGIMIDDNKNTQQKSLGQPYRGKTLVANNISYRNGAAGIHVFSSANVDVVNNTTYQNSQHPDTQYGEISTIAADYVKVFNNILYARKNGPVNNVSRSKNTVYGYNLVYNSSRFTTSLTNNILGTDPLFSDPARGDFRLRSGSLAIDKGSNNFNGSNAPSIDLFGLKRPQDGNGDGSSVVDIGALEVLSKAASAK